MFRIPHLSHKGLHIWFVWIREYKILRASPHSAVQLMIYTESLLFITKLRAAAIALGTFFRQLAKHPIFEQVPERKSAEASET